MSLTLARPGAARPPAPPPGRGRAPDRLARRGLWLVVLVALAALIAAIDLAYLPLAAAAAVLAVLIVVHPIVAIPVLLFAVPFGGLARPDVSETDLAAGPVEALVALLALAWLARGVRLHRIRVRGGAIVVAVVAICTLMLFSIGYAIQVAPAVKESLKWLELLVVLVVVLDLARDRRQVSWLLAALFVAGAAESLYGVAQFATGGGPRQFELDGALRAFGHFDQPNPFAGYLAMILPLAVMTALARPVATPFRLLALGTAPVLLAGIGLSQSRGAWLGVALATVVLFALWSHRTRLLLLPASAAALVFGLAALGGLLPPSIADRLAQTIQYFGVFDVRTVDLSSDNWAVVERMAHWQAGWYMFLDHPWLGVGAGNYAAAYPLYYVATWLDPLGHAHNYYLNTLAELGVVGLALLLLLLALVFYRLGGALVRSAAFGGTFWRATLAGVMGALVVFCVHNLFDNLFVHSVNVQMGFIVGVGLVAAARLVQESDA
jgi:putative inorganic carbon (hco3(-)) transporter